MEKTNKYCVHCHQSFKPCRNPDQQYCGQRVCQNARKRVWRKQKQIKDPDYRENQRRAKQAWHQRHPDYWRQYRKTHPSYTERNREQQRGRDQRRREGSGNASPIANPKASLLAKSDALSIKPTVDAIKSGLYRLIPVTRPDLAKSDALTVKISVITIS